MLSAAMGSAARDGESRKGRLVIASNLAL